MDGRRHNHEQERRESDEPGDRPREQPMRPRSIQESHNSLFEV